MPMMNSRPWHKQQKRRIPRLVIAVLSIAVLATLWRINIFREVTSIAALSVSAPVFSVGSDLKDRAAFFTEGLRSRDELAVENIRLRDERAALTAVEVHYQTLEAENRELRSILGMSDPDLDTVLADVLASPDRTPYDTLIINAGSSDGVAVGDRVITAHGGVALGEIKVAGHYTSRVVLFSSSGGEYDAVLGAEHYPVRIRGEGGGNFVAEFPREIGVVVGDEVILPAFGNRIVGVVGTIAQETADPFATLRIMIPVNMYTLPRVLVVRGNAEVSPEEEL